MSVLPSSGELSILRVLWDAGPSTVRQVHERLADRRGVGYNTIGKLLSIMEEKGLVRSDDRSRAHVFHPLVARDDIRQGLVRDLADRAFGGSTAALALHALSEKDLTESELDELRELLTELED